MSQPQCEHGRAVPITHLFCGGVGGGEMPSQVGEMSLGHKGGRDAPDPTAATLGRAGPVPFIDSTIESNSLAEVLVSLPQSCERGRAVRITYL